MSRHSLGAPVRLAFTVRDINRSLADPTGISLEVRKPDGTVLTYPAEAIVHDGVGLYHRDILPDDADQTGHYAYALTTTGVAAGVLGEEFDVFDPFEIRVLSLSEAKSFLDIPPGDTADDNELQDWINAVDEVIERIVGGPLLNRSVVERVTAQHDNTTLSVRQRPLVSVESIVDAASGQAQPIPDLDIDFNAGVVRRRLGMPFTGYGPNYVLTYTAGWGRAVTSPQKQAAKLILGHLWATEHGPSTRPSIGGSDMVTPPGSAYAVPNRAVELLSPQSIEAYL